MSEEQKYKYACAVPIWDGPYKMTCSYVIVNGKCVRHGKTSQVYEIKPKPEPDDSEQDNAR